MLLNLAFDCTSSKLALSSKLLNSWSYFTMKMSCPIFCLRKFWSFVSSNATLKLFLDKSMIFCRLGGILENFKILILVLIYYGTLSCLRFIFKSLVRILCPSPIFFFKIFLRSIMIFICLMKVNLTIKSFQFSLKIS